MVRFDKGGADSLFLIIFIGNYKVGYQALRYPATRKTVQITYYENQSTFLPFDKFRIKCNNNLCDYGQINKLSVGIWAVKSTAN